MTIVIICGAGMVSGKEIMALELGEGLRDKGARVVYVTSLWGNGDFSTRLKSRAFPFYRMRLGFISATIRADTLWMTIDQLLRWPKLLYDYRRFLRREQPRNVIHTNWHHVLMLWPFLRPNRDIYWLHEFVPDKPQYAMVFNRMAHRLHHFIVVSQSVADSLRRIGIADAQIRVIHNGINDPAELTQRRLHSVEGVAIGIVGQIGPWKGHDDLLEAFEIIAPRFPKATLHVFGANDKDFARELRRKAAMNRIAERVIWHGYEVDRAKIYRTIDICVVPSRVNDPLPTSAIEASFFALPVIATRKGGLPEIVIDGVTGYLVDAERPQQLADRLSDLLANADARRLMGAAARQRALQYFSRERFADDVVRVLEHSR